MLKTILALLGTLLIACVDVPARPPEQPEDSGVFTPGGDAEGGTSEDATINPEDTFSDIDSPDVADAAQPDVDPDAPALDAASDADPPDPCDGRSPTPEVCDEVDNDCDGLTDEDDHNQPLALACYSGPAGTAGEGTCRAGTRQCLGGIYQACAGEVLPTSERCDGLDNDCDGLVDEDDQGNTLAESCFDAAPELIGQGSCRAGTRTCTAGSWTPCIGQVLPQPEICDGLDNSCDGAIDRDSQGAALALSCYDGPAGTSGRGACVAGRLNCVNGAYAESCEGQVLPAVELCNGIDDDCDGQADEDGLGQPLRVSCYEGPPGTLDVGICRSGQRQCLDGSYGTCAAQQLPLAESCDAADNDCDGAADEGTLNACGSCAANCQQTTIGSCASCDSFDVIPGDNAEDVELDGTGALTLLETQGENTGVAWLVSSGGNRQVYKLDGATGRQIGRYRTPNDPSRTAVDHDGNAYIATRGSGTVVKIGNWTPICDSDIERCSCMDRDGDGVITTSKDVDGNGLVDTGEFVDNLVNCLDDGDPSDCQDECILWVSPYLGRGPRSIAIDLQGFIWVGDQDGRQNQIDPGTGLLVRSVDTDVASVYGSVMDSTGKLWFVAWSGAGCIQGLDTNTQVLDTVRCQPWSDRSSYGIALDDRDRIYVASYCNGSYIASRFDPVAQYWVRINHPVGNDMGGCTRGITVDSAGAVWVSHWGGSANRVTGFSSDFNNSTPHYPVVVKDILFNTNDCYGVLGLGLTSAVNGDKLWIGCYYRAHVVATSVEPGVSNSTYHPIGNAPYVYSDFTGNLYQTFTAPRGTLMAQLEGCPGSSVSSWVALNWSATTPPETQVSFKVRAATSRQALASAPWSVEYVQGDGESAAPVDLSMLPVLPFMEILIELEASEQGAAPRVHSYNVTRYCN